MARVGEGLRPSKSGFREVVRVELSIHFALYIQIFAKGSIFFVEIYVSEVLFWQNNNYRENKKFAES